MRVALIGCGLIGRKRAHCLRGAELAVCCDVNRERAERLAHEFPGAEASDNWQETVTRRDTDIIFVATTHDQLAKVATLAAESGKNVLVEKPGARRAAELEPVLAASCKSGSLVRFGFNHRFHPSVQKAREIYESGALGPLMFVRGRYGHGGRPGYDREWRAVPKLSGGGELIDQGSHLIDLARWFLGEFSECRGILGTFFWNMAVEDNAFLLLRTPSGQVASLHASWSEWKNLFSLEIYGRDGKLEIDGLGGSYGTERLAFYQMLPEMGPPPTTIWEYPMADSSWELETATFLEDIRLGRQPVPGIADTMAVLRVVETVYKENGL